MIEEIDKQLQSWAKALLADAEVTLDAPQVDRAGRGASLYLYQLAPAPPARGSKQPPLQAMARYLVTTWADSPAEAHQLLETLLFGAMEETAYEVDLSPLTPETWAHFGLHPCPAFVLSVLVKHERVQPPPMRVRRPLDVDTSPLVAVRGLVLGPDDIPMPGAHVDLPALQVSVHTDGNGFFQLPRVPTQPPTTRIRVRAKGHAQVLNVQPGTLGETLLIVRFATFDEAIDETA